MVKYKLFIINRNMKLLSILKEIVGKKIEWNADGKSYGRIYQNLKKEESKHGGIVRVRGDFGNGTLSDFINAVRDNDYSLSDEWDEPSNLYVIFKDGTVIEIIEAGY